MIDDMDLTANSETTEMRSVNCSESDACPLCYGHKKAIVLFCLKRMEEAEEAFYSGRRAADRLMTWLAKQIVKVRWAWSE